VHRTPQRMPDASPVTSRTRNARMQRNPPDAW
jgi:hypothetical protein